MDQFQDLKIVGFEEWNVRPSKKAPGLRIMPLRLSSTSPPGWASLLRVKYEGSWSGNKRSINVEGVYIYVDCAPEELNDILQDLKPMVAATNGEYRDAIARQDHLRGQDEKEAAAEKALLENIKKNLNFD